MVMVGSLATWLGLARFARRASSWPHMELRICKWRQRHWLGNGRVQAGSAVQVTPSILLCKYGTIPYGTTNTTSISLPIVMLPSNLSTLWVILWLWPTTVVAYSSYQPPAPQRPPSNGRSRQKNVAVVGTAGYAGAVTFGFIQRAAYQYDTRIERASCLGSTIETAQNLNRILAKSFLQAHADVNHILLADLFSIEDIAGRLQDIDALVMGTDLGVAVRPVTPHTFPTAQSQTCELYWPAPKGLTAVPENWTDLRALMLRNLLEAARVARIQHIVLVDDAKDRNVLQQLHATGIPYTCLGPTAHQLMEHPSYSCRMGVLDKLQARQLREREVSPTSPYLHREDLSALAVQCLLSLDWTQSRCLAVTSLGKLQDLGDDEWLRQKQENKEWCHNDHVLKEALGKKSKSFY